MKQQWGQISLQGLGKTVQVMALIAHLMEKKGNYGPHLIIVPNAVMVNWKAELTRWLPGVRCIYYVGTREVRSVPSPDCACGKGNRSISLVCGVGKLESDDNVM